MTRDQLIATLAFEIRYILKGDSDFDVFAQSGFCPHDVAKKIVEKLELYKVILRKDDDRFTAF